MTIQIAFLVSYISQHKPRIIEGELRCKQLGEYLDHLKLSKHVWLCEDASGINAKAEFDPKTNQLVGLVLPLHSDSGMPKTFTYMAKNAEDIHKYLQKPKSTLVYTLLAQPIKERAPPFILQIFGTDNKFRTVDVINRWKSTVEELEKCVIFILLCETL